LTKAASTPIPASIAAASISTLGRFPPAHFLQRFFVPSPPLEGSLAPMHHGGRLSRENFLRLVDLSAANASSLAISSSGNSVKSFKNRPVSPSSQLRQYCQYSNGGACYCRARPPLCGLAHFGARPVVSSGEVKP